VRTTPLDLAHERLETVAGDVSDFDAVNAAMDGVDAVAFAVGSGGGRDVRVYSDGIANVLHAMAVNEVDALVAVSAAGAFNRKAPELGIGFRTMVATVLKPVYDDMERMEQRIAASGVSWTIVRPVGLADDPATGHYRLSLDGSLLPKASRVSRADVAAVCLKALETGAFDRMTLVVAD
jgi:uncharacterized protein YbjT (DUF2867 family)